MVVNRFNIQLLSLHQDSGGESLRLEPNKIKKRILSYAEKGYPCISMVGELHVALKTEKESPIGFLGGVQSTPKKTVLSHWLSRGTTN